MATVALPLSTGKVSPISPCDRLSWRVRRDSQVKTDCYQEARSVAIHLGGSGGELGVPVWGRSLGAARAAEAAVC